MDRSELTQTMAKTTHKTVNRLARKWLNLNRAPRPDKVGINLYIKLARHKLDPIDGRNIHVRTSLDKHTS